MRYLIGIVFGLLIVFNWSSIKAYFDKQIDHQATSLSGQSSTQPSAQSAPAPQADKSNSMKQDLFKEFK